MLPYGEYVASKVHLGSPTPVTSAAVCSKAAIHYLLVLQWFEFFVCFSVVFRAFLCFAIISMRKRESWVFYFVLFISRDCSISQCCIRDWGKSHLLFRGKLFFYHCKQCTLMKCPTMQHFIWVFTAGTRIKNEIVNISSLYSTPYYTG